MKNIITDNLKELHKEMKEACSYVKEVTLSFNKDRALFYAYDDITMMTVVTLTREEGFDELVASIDANKLATMLKDSTTLSYNDAIMKANKGNKRAVTINIKEPYKFSITVPPLKPTNKIEVDTKLISDFITEATSLFKSVQTVHLKHIARELIVEVVDEGNNTTIAIPVEPIKGEMCYAKYDINLFKQLLGSGKVAELHFGDNYPMCIANKKEGYESLRILAPRVDND